jgi:hypothetical protein
MKKFMGIISLIFGTIGTISDAYAIIELTKNWNNWLSQKVFKMADLNMDAFLLTIFMVISLLLVIMGYFLVKNED